MRYVECPEIYKRRDREKSLFIAGGITGCRIWQEDLVDLLKEEDLVILNPRRKNFDITQKDISKEQIKWEFQHLKMTDSVSFWFPSETLCPITLYELGKVSMTDKPLFIGVDKNYSRKEDIEIQTKLIRPEVNLAYSLEDLSSQIKAWRKNAS